MIAVLTRRQAQRRKWRQPVLKADDELVERLSRLGRDDLLRWCERQWRELPPEEIETVLDRVLA